MTYTLTLDLIYNVSLIAEKVDYCLHHLPLTRTVFNFKVFSLVQFEALADLIDPKLQAQVETTEGFLLQDAHRVLTSIATGNLLTTLNEVGGVDVE